MHKLKPNRWGPPMSDVFVSYKAEDRKRVKPLVEALEADGYSVWWDEQIGGGAAWRQAIETELNAAKCVVVAWSKRSVGLEGTFVQDEATRAQQRRVYIPVLIDKVHLPLGFGEMQALPLTSWHGDRSDPRYQAVLAAVQRMAGSGLAPAPVAGRPVDRRMVLAGGAAAAVAVAGVGGWALLRPGRADAARSIAVLPFANLSGDPAQAYFSDGIAEELRTALSRFAGLKVVGRSSSEAVRNDDTETAADKLGVANILTGSVRNSPAVVRVKAQLIDGRSGLERWSESYDRAPGDAIKIQTDIAENVARALSVALGGAAGAKLTLGGTENAAAHNLVLQAQDAVDGGDKEGTDRALRLIDEALRLDPNYADAYARKALYLVRRGNAYASGSAELARYRAAAVPIAKKALSIAPDHPRAHSAMAFILQSQLNMSAAQAEYQRALQLAPGDAGVLRRNSYFAARLRNNSESLRLADKVLELDPLNAASYENYAGALYDARRYDETVRFVEQTERKSPELYDDPLLLGMVYLMLGKFADAREQFSYMKEDDWGRITGEALILARSGDRAGVAGKLERMERLFGDAASYQYAQIHAQLGDKERAIAALERAWAIRDAGLADILVDPMLDPVRREPRVQSIIKRMNFRT